MKFGDKLIALRKKNGLSQEELASKLNVSRQSVSKWESNNSYPETDKIVQICNLFDCSMDDLINDNITNLENIERKNKNNINIVFDSFLEFITKTINMFCDMKFISGFKCIIEMIIMAFILFFVGFLFVSLFQDIILNLFTYLPDAGYSILSSMIKGLLSILWFIFALIVLVHIFKIRYLNYYDKAIIEKEEKIDEPNKDVDNKKEKIKLEKKETIVIRDEKHRPFAFLSVCSKIIIFFIKAMIAFISLFFCVSLLAFAVALVVSLSLSIYSLLFIGMDIAIVSAIIINILILILFINFILDRKVNYKVIIITFIASIIVCGIGIGISVISFKNINFKDSIDDIIKPTIQEEKLKYDDDMIIHSNYIDNIEYVIDNNVEDIDMKLKRDERTSPLYVSTGHDFYGFELTEIHTNDISNFKDMYELVINDLKQNTLRNYDFASYLDIKVYAKEDVINKIIENTEKVYLVNIEKTNNGYILSNFGDKIIDESSCSINYDAKENKVTTYENDCSCIPVEDDGRIRFECTYDE